MLKTLIIRNCHTQVLEWKKHEEEVSKRDNLPPASRLVFIYIGAMTR